MEIYSKKELLETLNAIVNKDGAAESEDNSLRNFLPLNSYQKVIDPGNVLIVGDRGTGKTRLFQTLNQKDGYRSIYNSIPARSKLPQPAKITYLIGFTEQDTNYPSRSVCDRFITDSQSAESFWIGCACFVVYRHLQSTGIAPNMADSFFDKPFLSLLKKENGLKSVNEWLPVFTEKLWQGEGFLDEVDANLKEQEQYLSLTYDGLDMITSSYHALIPVIHGLLNFWSFHKRRWKNLGAKIFLRKDLMENPSIISFSDSSKLQKTFLVWSKHFLYQLLIKRFANSTELAYTYTRSVSETILKPESKELGCLPSSDEETQLLFTEKLIGKYMGNNPKKGLSYNWVPNHIQDANSLITPRSFLKCFSDAAAVMLENENELVRLEADRILSPGSIQSAMFTVSEDRVNEICESYPWLRTLKPMLSGIQLLTTEDTFLKRIDTNRWTKEDLKQLPTTEKKGILEFLQKIGILYYVPDKRINVPEIYLHGFDMVRKGGIKPSK